MSEPFSYSSPEEASSAKTDVKTNSDTSKDDKQDLSRNEFVIGSVDATARIYQSDPTTPEDAAGFIVTPKWLMTSILNQTITAKTAPFLLFFAGLPCSSKSKALNTLMHHYLHKNEFDHNDKCGIRFFDFSAIRRPPANDIIYSSIDQLLNNGYILVVKSAIEYLLRVRGQFIKSVHNPSSIATDKVYFNDQEFDHHLITVFNGLSMLADLEKPKLKIPYWSQGIASGISMINIWDIGLNKVAFYILPRLAGLLHNSRSWLFFDIFRDLPNLYQPPYIPENKYDASRNDSDCSMRWRARIHYLLRFAKLAQSCPTRENICKLIGTYSTTNEDSDLADFIESFKKDIKCAATQMKVDNVIDMDNVISYNPNDLNTANVFKELLDGVVCDKFSNPIEMPLSFIFLRSVLYANDAFCIGKNDLRLKAKKLKIEGDKFENFCQLFTSFGSIIDVSLIDSSSDLVILKPVDFLRELDKLFYPSPNVDPLVTTYGFVTESTANFIFGREKASTIMSFLTSIGFATKLSSLQVNFSISDQYVYYISTIGTSSPTLTCHPASLHLLRDVNIPLSNFQTIFATTFLSLYSLTTLEIPDDPHINITRFRAFPSNVSNKEGVVFDLVYLGDAIEFRFPTLFNQGSSDYIDVCTQIITVCHKVMPSDAKYNFAVMCSADPDPNAAYKLKRNSHILPNTNLCEICQVNSRLDSAILQTWNTVLSKDENKVPEGKRLNGDPMTIDEAFKVTSEMSKLLDETLLLFAKHLDIPAMELSSSKEDKWRYCMKMIFAWEDLTKQKEEEASKKALAIKLMNAANEIHSKNKEESKKLEIIARCLNFQVALSMMLSGDQI